jgi:hypothetical protein
MNADNTAWKSKIAAAALMEPARKFPTPNPVTQ